MLTSKTNIFCLYKVLFDYSDADHILTRKEMTAKPLPQPFRAHSTGLKLGYCITLTALRFWSRRTCVRKC